MIGTSRVRLVVSEGCHLCEPARAVVTDVCAEVGITPEIVVIDGDPDLETQYREFLPVLEVDGKRVATYFVHAEALRAALA